jgi:hypothetical protein
VLVVLETANTSAEHMTGTSGESVHDYLNRWLAHARGRVRAVTFEGYARFGYECAHAIVDDHSRLAFVGLHPDERASRIAHESRTGDDDAVFVGEDDGLNAVAEIEFHQDAADVALHGRFRYDEPLCDLAV